MKLYFYFLRLEEILIEECDVIQKKKTYQPVNMFPENFHRNTLRKDEIGKIIGYARSIVVLPDLDVDKASEIFSMEVEGIIKEKEIEIEKIKSNIEHQRKKIKMIERWRANYE